MGETWRGIYPITAFVRDALRKKVERDTATGLSEPESTLLTVCEFWAAVNSGTLADWLQTDAAVHVMLAQRAFTRLGAHRVASALRVVVT